MRDISSISMALDDKVQHEIAMSIIQDTERPTKYSESEL